MILEKAKRHVEPEIEEILTKFKMKPPESFKKVNEDEASNESLFGNWYHFSS